MRQTGYAITIADADYMADNEGFIIDANNPLPTTETNKNMTRLRIDQHFLNVDTAYLDYSTYVDNRLVPYHQLSPEDQNCTNGIDLAIILDITGSMGGEMDSLKNSLPIVIDKAISKYDDYRLSLFMVDDVEITDGSRTSYYYLSESFAFSNRDAVINAVDSVAANGGGNTPESHDLALDAALQGEGGSFRDGIARLAFVITDAPNAMGEDAHGQTQKDFAEQLGIDAYNLGVRVYCANTEDTDKTTDTQAALKLYSDNSGGESYEVPSGDVRDALDNAIYLAPCVTEANADITIDPFHYFGSGLFEEFTVDVTANGDWTAQPNNAWVDALTTSGTSGTTTITIRIQENNSGSSRNGSVDFSMSGQVQETLTIDQEA